MPIDIFFYVIVALAAVVAGLTYRAAKRRFALRWHVNLIGAAWVALAVFTVGAWWLSASGVLEQALGLNAPKVGFAAPMNATIIAIGWYAISIQLPGFIRFMKNRIH